MKKNRKIIYLAGFLFSISLALTSYINSSFLENYINEYYIGAIYIIASIITIIGLLEMPRILTRLGNRSTTIFFSILCFLSLILLAFSTNSYVAISAFIIYFVSSNFIIASLDIFIEDFSQGLSIGKQRGLYLMIINLAWVVSQMISGSVIAKSSFLGIYLLSASFMLLVSIIFLFFLQDFRDPKYTKIPILKTLKVFITNKNVSKIYFINLILKLFFAWMIIYTPIYLYEYMNFGWDKIGLIFTIMLIPFILVDYPLGKLSDKIGEKKMLIGGFFITAIFTLFIPFISEPKIWIWALILFGTRVGAATIEIMSETYFFKVVNERKADEISFFRNTTPISFIIGPALAIPTLLLVPSFKYLFVVLGTLMIFGLLLSLRIKDTK